jgi:HupE / UreJ protein
VLRCVLLSLALIASASPGWAHLASDSYLQIEIGDDRTIRGQWDIALRDLDVAVGLDTDQDGKITWGELRRKAREIEAYAFGRLALDRGGRACTLAATHLLVDRHAGYAYAVLPFTTECPANGRLTLRYRLLFDLDPSHRGLLTIVAGGQFSADVLTPDHTEIMLEHDPERLGDQAARFLAFGFDHILLGYDHLLFIAVLLVTAALRRAGGSRWMAIDGLGGVLIETIKTLTAFTLAHAIVLTPAVFGMVNLPARLVEPAVALTIMLAAFDNIHPILPRLRWQVAFLFGLIHGLSFASVLGPMRLPPLGFALALSSFNIGVEAGQIALALLLVPISFVLRHESVYRRLIAPGVSACALFLAGVWFMDRVFALNLLSLQSIAMAGGER